MSITFDILEDHASDRQSQAVLAADFAETFLMHVHRGVIDCDDYFILYGNDGYRKDARSQRETEILLNEFSKHDPAFGVSHEGCTWAILLTDYTRSLFDESEMNATVWNAWMQACDEAQEKVDIDEQSATDGPKCDLHRAGGGE